LIYLFISHQNVPKVVYQGQDPKVVCQDLDPKAVCQGQDPKVVCQDLDPKVDDCMVDMEDSGDLDHDRNHDHHGHQAFFYTYLT
jgi:hypothetical protein